MAYDIFDNVITPPSDNSVERHRRGCDEATAVNQPDSRASHLTGARVADFP